MEKHRLGESGIPESARDWIFPPAPLDVPRIVDGSLGDVSQLPILAAPDGPRWLESGEIDGAGRDRLSHVLGNSGAVAHRVRVKRTRSHWPEVKPSAVTSSRAFPRQMLGDPGVVGVVAEAH